MNKKVCRQCESLLFNEWNVCQSCGAKDYTFRDIIIPSMRKQMDSVLNKVYADSNNSLLDETTANDIHSIFDHYYNNRTISGAYEEVTILDLVTDVKATCESNYFPVIKQYIKEDMLVNMHY
ncbi:hypothetical protein [Rossellomorea marisflavi]|uniref:hypothetical protein n=1 Tax=Rossellomorea marisflavi TaxID=189381 RepID=UPI003F9F41B6